MIQLTDNPIHPRDLIEAVSSPEIGAIATFFGTVRAHNAGKSVTAVEYHAYPSMAVKKLEQIAEETRRGFGVDRIAIVHRVGRLSVGEMSVAIAVGSAHRRDALGAAAYAIERIKQTVPIWKKEIYADGTAWLEPEPVFEASGSNSRNDKTKKGGRPAPSPLVRVP